MKWSDFTSQHKPGDVIDGVVTGTVDFGSWVEYAGFTGLVHGQTLPVGAAVAVRILAIDPERERFSLEQV
ncbi:small subunit ribosomal protein S1 [Actinokineospora baliensis]|uniref:S1 RNA-binding domain-containing protein n=1 Tax=Actinokineospora baliensis TaxID=547056 RepID=UPI00195E9867|nr:S1 RNA-binding domain-containing protein [Actinokineospora baliensis]MBM7772344.1 small subunit ribosomal protein S1 [Actinokineospora baliensis]